MKIFGMGVPELVIILIVALLIFGPKNLPKLGSALGKTVKNLREGMGSVQQEVDEEFSEDEEDGAEEAEILALEEGDAEPAANQAAAPKKKVAKKAAKKSAE